FLLPRPQPLPPPFPYPPLFRSQRSGPAALAAIDDQIMVLVRRAVDEDVNLFDRTRLQATSARDLFASQLLSMRTPGDVYKNILLDRKSTRLNSSHRTTSYAVFC